MICRVISKQYNKIGNSVVTYLNNTPIQIHGNVFSKSEMCVSIVVTIKSKACPTYSKSIENEGK